MSDGSKEYHPEYVDGLQKVALDMALCLESLMSPRGFLPDAPHANEAVSAYYKHERDNCND